MKEKTLRNKVIRDLQAKRINVINCHRGTFDTLVDGTNPFLLELKIITIGGGRGFDEKIPAFVFTEDQTDEIPKMKFPIYVLAKFNNDYFLFDPTWVKKQVTELKGYRIYNRAIIQQFRWNEQDIVPPITYDEAINNIAKIVMRRQRL